MVVGCGFNGLLCGMSRGGVMNVGCMVDLMGYYVG